MVGRLGHNERISGHVEIPSQLSVAKNLLIVSTTTVEWLDFGVSVGNGNPRK
jgi:hypothetical protein